LFTHLYIQIRSITKKRYRRLAGPRPGTTCTTSAELCAEISPRELPMLLSFPSSCRGFLTASWRRAADRPASRRSFARPPSVSPSCPRAPLLARRPPLAWRGFRRGARRARGGGRARARKSPATTPPRGRSSWSATPSARPCAGGASPRARSARTARMRRWSTALAVRLCEEEPGWRRKFRPFLLFLCF
jgi:hypothetical protein